MCSALLIIHQTRPEVVIALDSVKVEALLKITQLWKYHCTIDPPESDPDKGRPGNILGVINMLWAYRCSDHRDRIYALYSIASDIVSTNVSRKGLLYTPARMEVNYSLTLRQTHVTLARACIDSGRWVDVFNAVFARQYAAQDWPSWVPDWRVPLSHNYVKLPPRMATLMKEPFNFRSGPHDSLAIDCSMGLIDEMKQGLIRVEKPETFHVQSHQALQSLLRHLRHGEARSILADVLWDVLGCPETIARGRRNAIGNQRRDNVRSSNALLVCADYLDEIASQVYEDEPSRLAGIHIIYPGMTERLLDQLQKKSLFIAKNNTLQQFTGPPGEEFLSWLGFGSAALQVGDEFCCFISVESEALVP